MKMDSHQRQATLKVAAEKIAHEGELRHQANQSFCEVFPRVVVSQDTDLGSTFAFTKALVHDANGQVKKEDLQQLIDLVIKCPCQSNQLQLGGSMKLACPSAVHSCSTDGPVKYDTPCAPPPASTSAETLIEMIELYWMALLRDIPFEYYESDALVQEACKELSKVSKQKVTPEWLFRSGPLETGYYVSQFLLQPFKEGGYLRDQKYLPYAEGQEFLITPEAVLQCQNGNPAADGIALERATHPRYISTLRDGATYVHGDEPSQAYYNAAMILYDLKVPTNPKSAFRNGVFKNEGPFLDLGKVDLYDLLHHVTRIALQCCWYHKWTLLRCRPEALSFHLDRCLRQGEKRSHFEGLEKWASLSVFQRTYDQQSNYLLSQAYPEGSPAHPSFPSGHAVIAGACTTILKAFFDGEAEIDEMIPSAHGQELIKTGKKVKVADELDKLATNMGYFRNAAGIHYRSDAEDGIRLGEQIAVSYLKVCLQRYPFPTGCRLRLRDHQKVVLENEVHHFG